MSDHNDSPLRTSEPPSGSSSVAGASSERPPVIWVGIWTPAEWLAAHPECAVGEIVG